jgi:type I restriction enzyme M protein
LEGLDISEWKFSRLERSARIDAEFFQKHHIEIERKFASRSYEVITKVATVSDGNHFAISNAFSNEGVPYYRGQDVVGHFFIEQADPYHITIEAFQQSFMKRSYLHKGDVLLSIIGTVGEASLVRKERKATCSCKLAILRPKAIKPAYLATYLSSNVGHTLTDRWKRGAVQTGLLLEDMDQFPVARFDSILEEKISEVVDVAYKMLENSRETISQAETTLLRALNLENWQAPEPLSYVRNSREAFAAGRFDAEYFQPKFSALISHLQGMGNVTALGKVLTVNQRGQQPEYTDIGLPVVNSKHVSSCEVSITEDNRFALKKAGGLLILSGDVLINGTGVGTIGRCAPYLHEAKAIPDNHVTILRPETGIDFIYLAVFLNSIAGQFQVEQRLRGSSGQIELYPNDIAQFTLWQAPIVLQKEIRRIVEESFSFKQCATHLLESAKRAVEIAIEQNEAAALDFLRDASSLP